MADEIKQDGNTVQTEISKQVPQIAGGGLGFLGGPLVGAAGSIAGGLISNLFNRRQQNQAENFQRELAQHGVSWRVQDAKNAGIHPLFALGAQIPQVNPMVLGDSLGPSLAQAGQMIGNSMANQLSTEQKAMEFAQYQAAISQADRNFAEAGYFNSLTAKNQQSMMGEAPNPLGIHHENPMAGQKPAVPGGSEGLVNIKAVDQPTMKAGRPGIQSGVYEGHQIVRLAPGLPMVFPALEGEAWMEHWSEMSWLDKMAVVNRNAEIYGGDWAKDFWAWYWNGTTPQKPYSMLPPPQKYKPASRSFGQKFKDFGESLFK